VCGKGREVTDMAAAGNKDGPDDAVQK